MRILIVGGSGFGGSGLTHELLKRGYDVRILDMTAPLHASLLEDVLDQIDYRWKFATDITKEDVEGCNIVLHFAAQADVPMGYLSPTWTIYNNLLGTVSVLEACKGLEVLEKVFIASSGNAVQFSKSFPINSETPPSPRNIYGASKGCQELIALAYYRSFGVPIVIYRNGIIYGPHMRREIFIYKWFWNMLHNKPCVLEGGDQTRDPTYVTDTLDAWLLGIEADSDLVVGETFQVSYGQEFSVKEILDYCYSISGMSRNIIQKPYRPGEQGMREWFDINKARKILGYSPKVGLAEGLAKTWDWVKSLG